MSNCSNCDSPVAPEDRFCGNCGSTLQLAAGPTGGAHASAGEGAPAAAPAREEPRDAFSEEISEQFQPTIIEASNPAPAPSAEDTDAVTQDGGAPPALEVEDAAEPAGNDGGEAPAPVAESRPADTGEDLGDRHPGTVPRPSRTGSTGGSNRRASRTLDPGTLLNSRYEIVRKIGGGGMGAVYYAKDKNLGDAPRAVKEMIQSQLDESQHEKAVADFKRESMLLAELEHPSIPTIYDYFYDEASGRDGRFYLVMKYISGGDFLARLKSAPAGRIEELKVAEWGMQIADVLDYLHNRRPPIIYRDLKPANLMIDGNTGRVMLIDFGIARWVAPQEKGVTAVGTMGYAPPELFSGKAEPRTDIYSLGATMFHLMTGSDPQDQPLLIFDFTKNPRPRQINPSISNEMERILMRAVEYSVEGRFSSAAEMRDVLRQHVERLRTGGVTYGPAHVPGPPAGAGSGHIEPVDMRTHAHEMVFCGFCGKAIASEDVFCAHCGARQPIAAASASLRAARATARLVVAGTTELDATFPLHKESTLVGRTDPQSNIFPDVDLSRFDPETKISRRHARIWREGETFLVEDLGSVNGTWVNDAIRLGPRQPRHLANGDRLRLGETTLHFLIG
jgi:tRNA A-37 threonylcarbamoyl transferase component Bud32